METNNHDEIDINELRSEIEQYTPSKQKRLYKAIFMAALGSIPWVGSAISAIASMKLDEDEINRDNLQSQWLEEHTTKLTRLKLAFDYMQNRFDNLGDEISDRIQSEEYLGLVRKAFRVWENADTDEKRKYIADLITNASAISLTSDNVVRLFIEWLNNYHEVHFAVIKEIYKNPRISRYEIWQKIYGKFPREDSAEADLFRMIIRDLSIGGVIRQARVTTEDGHFLKTKKQRIISNSSTNIIESAFEREKPYVLTELGKQFVHYTMTELVPRMSTSSQ